MKIGFFTDSYFPEVDGVTYTIEAWKERLEERGHDVYVVYPESEEYESEEMEIPIKSVPNPFYRGYRIPLPLFRDPYPDLDIVHCQSPAFLGISGLRYSRKNNLPAIYTHHTPIEEYFEQSIRSSLISSLLENLYVPVENFLLKRFDALTSSTSDPRRSVEFRKLPVGVDMEFFKPGETDFFRDKELERPVIGYSGRLSMEKNILELLEMAEGFDGTLVVVGEGPMKERVEEEKPENVIRRDFLEREELPDFYSSLDAFVTASTGDTLGLSTLEANACGTPVVAPEVFPFKNTIGEKSGVLYSCGDMKDFRVKIRRAIESDRDTRESVKEYSLSSTIDELEEIYDEVS